jgi:phosphoglycolate phosphatase
MLHVIWDLDGTLINSQHEIIYTIELALQDAGITISDAVNPIKIGPPLSIMLRQAFPDYLLTNDKLIEVISYFRKRYDTSNYKMTVPYDGIGKIIMDKKKFIHHIITNKPHCATRRIVEKMGWSNQFTTITTPEVKSNNTVINEDGVNSKIGFFADLIKEHGGNHSLFIGIGDMKSDCIAAKDNNIKSIGVLWGTGAREELSDCCDYLFDDTKQLYNFLHKII